MYIKDAELLITIYDTSLKQSKNSIIGLEYLKVIKEMNKEWLADIQKHIISDFLNTQKDDIILWCNIFFIENF